MAQRFIDKAFYDAICQFETSESAQDYYYQIMNTKTGRMGSDGMEETVKDQILRVYAMLFCEDVPPGSKASVEDVEISADRLYIGEPGFDPQHWYRMQHHFPVIDEDNYDRFAALIIADLNAGPLRSDVLDGEKMLLVGEANPLLMTREQRQNQHLRVVDLRQEDPS